MERKTINCFECEGLDCDSLSLIDVCKNAQKCYTMTLFESNGERSSFRGCIFDRDQVPYYCHSQTAPKPEVKVGGYYFVECCDEELCNSRIFQYSHPNVEINNNTDVPTAFIDNIVTQLPNIATIASVITVFILLLLLLYKFLYLRCIQRNSSNRLKTYFGNVDKIDIGNDSCKGGSSLGSLSTSCVIKVEDETQITDTYKMKEKLIPSNDLISNSALRNEPLDSINLTLAHQIQFIERLSKGNFGRSIWHGIYNEENVAVKIFLPNKQESLFHRETDIYVAVLTNRHENLVNYVGSDTIRLNLNNAIHHYLVVQYYPHGSLYNFLVGLSKPLNYKQMFDLCISLSKGLLYLHTEICGSHGKIILAHRNLTSKNIMVNANGLCAIGEFGYAVTQEILDKSCIDLEVGSKRYMSPEILTKKINDKNLADFLCSDVYSMGLIMWEICRRHSKLDFSLNYAAPYSEWLEAGQNPDLEIMRKLVVDKQLRPSIPISWQHDQKLNHIGVMLKECWYSRPASRLTALRIKKSLVQLAKQKPKVKVSVS